MKKVKFALVALAAILGVGGAIASTHHSELTPVYASNNRMVFLEQKGDAWDCESASDTCVYTSADLQHPVPGIEDGTVIVY